MITVEVLAKTRIAPVLRSLGFLAHGLTFYLTGPDGNVEVIAFQKSRDRGVPKFTVNGGVWCRLIAGAVQRYPSVWDCQYLTRVGRLMNPPRDAWWYLPPDLPESAISKLVEDLDTALTALLIPNLEAHLSNAQLCDFWISRWSRGVASFAEVKDLSRLLNVLGPTDAADAVQTIVDAGPTSFQVQGPSLTEILREFGHVVSDVAGKSLD